MRFCPGSAPAVIARTRTHDCAAATLQAGEDVAAYALHPTLIAELLVTAEAAQRPDRVAHGKQVAQDVERATATLKVIGHE